MIKSKKFTKLVLLFIGIIVILMLLPISSKDTFVCGQDSEDKRYSILLGQYNEYNNLLTGDVLVTCVGQKIRAKLFII